MSNKKGFTLIELIIAIALFGIGLIAVFVVLTSGFKTMSQARGQVIAINLAREGAEMMFNLRDTNLRKRSGKRDLCFLNRKSLFATSAENCENEDRLGDYFGGSSISYIPTMATYGLSLTPLMVPDTGALNIFDGITGQDAQYELMVSSSGVFLPAMFFSGALVPAGCTTFGAAGDELTTTAGCETIAYSPAGRFYRAINNVGLYDKDATVTGGNLMQCTNGAASDLISGNPCGGSGARELRFCSEVQYVVDTAKRTVSVCSLMTNFKE